MLKRVGTVIWMALQPLPALGNWGPIVAALALVGGGSGALAASIGIGGADRVSGGLLGIIAGLAILVVLFLLSSYRFKDELDENIAKTPILQFGDPQEDNNVIVDGTAARMWRIPLENTRPGSQALHVRARIHNSEPTLFSVPLSMHEAHDNQPPFRREWNIAYGQPINLDLISEDLENLGIFYLFRGDGDMHTYSDLIGGRLGADLMEAAANGGVTFTLRAVSDPPTRAVEQTYMLYQEQIAGNLHMKKDGGKTILG